MKKKITFLLILAAAFLFIFRMGSHVMEVLAATPDTEAKEDNYDASFTFSFSSASGITAEELHDRANGDGLFTFTTVELDEIHTYDKYDNPIDVTYISSTIDFTNKGSLTIVWDGETSEEKAAAFSGTVYYVLPAKTDENGNPVLDGDNNPTAIDTDDLCMFYYDVVAEKWLSPSDGELCMYDYLQGSYAFYKATYKYAKVDAKTHEAVYQEDPTIQYEIVGYGDDNYCTNAPVYTYYGLTSPEDRFFASGTYMYAGEDAIRGTIAAIWQNGTPISGGTTFWEISVNDDVEFTVITSDTGYYCQLVCNLCMMEYFYNEDGTQSTSQYVQVNFDADGKNYDVEFHPSGEKLSGKYAVGSILPVYYKDENTNELVERIVFVYSIEYKYLGGDSAIPTPSQIDCDYSLRIFVAPADYSVSISATINGNYAEGHEEDKVTYTAGDTEHMIFTLIDDDDNPVPTCQALYGVYNNRFYYCINPNFMGKDENGVDRKYLPSYLQITIKYKDFIYTEDRIGHVVVDTEMTEKGLAYKWENLSDLDLSYYTVELDENSDATLELDACGIYPAFSEDTGNWYSQYYFWVKGLKDEYKAVFTVIQPSDNEALSIIKGINYIRLSNLDGDVIRTGQTIIRLTQTPFEETDSRTYHVYYYISEYDPYPDMLNEYGYYDNEWLYTYDECFVNDYYMNGLGMEMMMGNMAATQDYEYGASVKLPILYTDSSFDTSDPNETYIQNSRPRTLLYWYCPSLKGILGEDITTITDDIVVYGVWAYWNEATMTVQVNPYGDNSLDDLEFGLSLSKTEYVPYYLEHSADLVYKLVYDNGILTIHYDMEFTSTLYLFMKYDGLEDYVFVTEVDADFLTTENEMKLYQVIVDKETPNDAPDCITVTGAGWYYLIEEDETATHSAKVVISYSIEDGYYLDKGTYNTYYSAYPLDDGNNKIEFTPVSAVYLKLVVLANVHTLSYSFRDSDGHVMTLPDGQTEVSASVAYNTDLSLAKNTAETFYYYADDTKILYYVDSASKVYLIYKVEYRNDKNALQTVTGRMLDMDLTAVVYAKEMNQTPISLSITMLDSENPTGKSTFKDYKNSHFLATSSSTSIADILDVGFFYDSEEGLYYCSDSSFYLWYSFDGKNYTYIGTDSGVDTNVYKLNLTISSGMLNHLTGISHLNASDWVTPDSSMSFCYSDLMTEKNVYFKFDGEYEAYLDGNGNSSELSMRDYILNISSMTADLKGNLSCKVKEYKIIYTFVREYSSGGVYNTQSADLYLAGTTYSSYTQMVVYNTKIDYMFAATDCILIRYTSSGSTVGGTSVVTRTEFNGSTPSNGLMPAKDLYVTVYANDANNGTEIYLYEITSAGTSGTMTDGEGSYNYNIISTDCSNIFLSKYEDHYEAAEGQYIGYDPSCYKFFATNTNGDSNYYFWYLNSYGDWFYIGNYVNSVNYYYAFTRVTFELCGDDADEFSDLTSDDVTLHKNSDCSYYAYVQSATNYFRNVLNTSSSTISFGFTEGYKLSAEASDVMDVSGDEITLKKIRDRITIKLYAVPKDYTVYYFETEDDYLSYYGTGDTSLAFRTASVTYLTEEPEFYASGDSLFDESSNKRLASWIDSKTGKIAAYDYMPCNDLYLYGNWVDCSTITLTLSMKDYDSETSSLKERRTEEMLRLSSSKTTFTPITSDLNPDGIFTYDSVNGTYTFVYNSVNKESNYIWIIYPYTDKAVYFMDADDVMSRDYTLYKFNNKNSFENTPFELSNGGWYEYGTADVIFTVRADVTDDSYLGYILSDSDQDEEENITFTRTETSDGKIILRARIKNYAMDDEGHEIIGNENPYHISVTKRIFYIYYYSNTRQFLQKAEYTYRASITPIDGTQFYFGAQTFADWIDAEGVSLSDYGTMPLKDVVVYAKLSDFKYMTATFHYPSDYGLTVNQIYVSLSDKYYDAGSNKVTADGNVLTFKFKGTGYLWYLDSETGEYSYLGKELEDKMDLYFVKITPMFNTPNLSITGLGYRLIGAANPIVVTPDVGYSFTAEGYSIKGDKIILTNVSRNISMPIRQEMVQYTLSYYVQDVLVHRENYTYGESVTMWEYEGEFNFFMWSETLTTMPCYDVVVYAYENANYTVYELPSVTKIHSGQCLGDSVISGGKICIGTDEIDGTYRFKDIHIAPSMEDSMTTEYEVIFTPSSQDKVPYTFTLTIEVCNPQYPAESLISPVLLKRTDHMLSFMVNSSYEYSMDGKTYYSGSTVNLYELMPDTEFTVYYRYRENLDYCTSDEMTVVFRTYSEDEYKYILAQENGAAILSEYQRILDYSDVRDLMAEYGVLIALSYEDSDMSGEDATELVEYMNEVFAVMAEIDSYRGSMKNLNSSRTEWYSETRCSEIAALAESNESIEKITDYKNFILRVFDSSDYMVGLYDVKNSDLKGIKLTSLEDGGMDTESVYVINKVDELMKYGYDEYKNIDVKDYQNSFVAGTVGLMSDSVKAVHSCDGTSVTSIIGTKVSVVQTLTYLDYKFDREAYDKAFYLAAEAAVVAHIQGIVLEDIDTQYALMLEQITDLPKRSMLAATYEVMVNNYKDYDTFKAMYDEIIGDDGSVTYEDCIELFHEKVVKTLVPPQTYGLTSVELIILIGFASVITGCVVFAVVRYEVKRRRLIYERR